MRNNNTIEITAFAPLAATQPARTIKASAGTDAPLIVRYYHYPPAGIAEPVVGKYTICDADDNGIAEGDAHRDGSIDLYDLAEKPINAHDRPELKRAIVAYLAAINLPIGEDAPAAERVA